MNPIQPEELSALIDGELDAQRECEIRAELAVNAQLRAELEVMNRLDISIRAAAAEAAFDPTVKSPTRSEFPWRSTLLLVLLLVFIRVALKLVDTEALVWAVNAAAFAAVIIVMMRLLRHAEADRRMPS